MDERNLFDWQSGDLIEEGKMNLINKSIRDIWIQLDELSTETGEISIEALQVKYEVEHNNSLYFNVQDFLDYVSGKLLNLDKKDTELLETIKNKKVSVDEIEYKTETYVTLKDFLDSIQAILQEMSDEMDLTVETVNDMNEKVIDVTEGFNEVETEVISVKNSIKLVNSTIDLIKADIEALQNKKIDISEISYVNGTYITLKSFLDYVGSKLNSLDSKDTELNNAITVLRNAITTLQNKKYNATDIAFTHETYTTVDTFVRYLERTLDDIGTDVEGIKETLETIEEELDIDVYTIKYTKRDCITLGNYLDFIDVTIDDLYDNIDTINLDLDTKVDKEEGKSLVSDTEIERLANVDNYDDTEVRGLITNLQNTKVDKEEGKSLISTSEIERLSNVDNYDDTEVRELINTKSDTTHKHDELYATKESEHTHSNQEILEGITQQLIDLWSKKLVIKYDSETMDLYIGLEDADKIAYVEYIENTSESYIDTGLYANYNWKYEIVLQDNAHISYENYFGTNSTNVRLLRNSSEGSLLFGYGSESTHNYAITGKKVTIYVDRNKLYIDDELITTATENASTTSFDKTLLLFQARYQNSLDKYGVFKCYSFKAWNEDDTLVLNLRPCLDNTNVPCMYDEVSKQYFYNAGSGTFAYGKRLDADYTAHIYSADNIKDNQLLNKTDSSVLPITMYNNLSVVNLNGYNVIRATQSDSYAHSEPIEIPNKFSMDFVVYIEDKTQEGYIWTTQNKDFEDDNQYGYWYLWTYGSKLSLRYRGVGSKSASYLVYDFNLDYANKKIFNITFTVDMGLKTVRVIIDGVDLSTPTQSNLDTLDANQNPSGTSNGTGERLARMTIGNNFGNTRPALVNGLIAMRYYTRVLTVDDIVKIQEENKTKYEY